MRFERLISVILLGVIFLLSGFGLPRNLSKKVKKEIEKTFEVAQFEWHSIVVSESVNESLPTVITEDNFFGLKHNEELIGYAFVDQAPSKTAKFDYLVLFNVQLEIINSKVLVYREEYGGEIGSKRWLKQFLGKSGGDRVDFESNIDGISGATISVRSMTLAMDNLLQTVSILQEKNIL